MKKFTLFAAGALVALGASAQYTCDPTTADVAAKGPKSVEFLVLSEDGQKELSQAGATLSNWGPDDVNKFFYIWENTMIAGDGSYPGVDFAEGTYLSLEVGSVGWSGGGYFVSEAAGLSSMNFNDNTRFHCAYMCPNGNAPASLALILLDGDPAGSAPAKVAVGTSFVDGGSTYPTIGPALSDDWQGIDISFADLKKFYPQFNYVNTAAWQGNALSILAGGVTGQAFALDTVYFYNTDDAGVGSVFAENEVFFVVTENTVNVNGTTGIELYNAAGQLVKSTEGAALGINNLTPGVYVAKSGNHTVKVAVK